MQAAELLIQTLEKCGIEVIFGIPGAKILAIYDALSKSSKLRHVLTRHEQGAVHAADGYARASGKLGVVFATSGPGATNLVTGIATAYMDSVPLLLVTGQVTTSAIGTDAFQEADITTITLPVTKHSYLVKDAGKLQDIIEEAIFIATSGRKGPVLIDIPSDIQTEIVKMRPHKIISSLPTYRPTIKGNTRQIRQAAKLLRAAKRPLIIAGGGVTSSLAYAELNELIKICQAPVITTMMAKTSICSDSKFALGMAGVHGSRKTELALENCDLLIALGTRFSERATAGVSGFAAKAKIIHIDIDPAEIGKNIVVDVPIVGDLKTVLAELLLSLDDCAKINDGKELWLNEFFAEEKLPSPQSWQLPAVTDDASTGLGDSVNCQKNLSGFRPDESLAANVFRALSAHAVMKNESLICVTDVGQHQILAALSLDLSYPQKFLTSGGLGTMGFGLPAAIGAQSALPNAVVLCLTGDGSLQMCLQEMAIATIEQLPLKVILFDNKAYGLVRQWQKQQYKCNYTQTSLDYSPDFSGLAKAYDWAYLPLLEADAAKAAIDWLFSQKVPAMLDVKLPKDGLMVPFSGGINV